MSNVTYEIGDWVDLTGTSRRSKTIAKYHEIVAKFGEPTRRSRGDTYNEWAIQLKVWADDGDFDYVTASIYDWNAHEDPRTHPHKDYAFMIGGHSMEAAFHIHQILGK